MSAPPLCRVERVWLARLRQGAYVLQTGGHDEGLRRLRGRGLAVVTVRRTGGVQKRIASLTPAGVLAAGPRSPVPTIATTIGRALAGGLS